MNASHHSNKIKNHPFLKGWQHAAASPQHAAVIPLQVSPTRIAPETLQSTQSNNIPYLPKLGRGSQRLSKYLELLVSLGHCQMQQINNRVKL